MGIKHEICIIELNGGICYDRGSGTASVRIICRVNMLIVSLLGRI